MIVGSIKEDKSIESVPEELIIETEHTISVGGETIAYRVTTGTMLIKEEDEKKFYNLNRL